MNLYVKINKVMDYIEFILLVFIVLGAYTLGWLLTETKYRLARWPLFQFEAFECRQCLTFHLIWAPSVAFGLYIGSWVVGLVGVLFAFIVWAGIKIDTKKRTRRI